jgi:hypothetical protein
MLNRTTFLITGYLIGCSVTRPVNIYGPPFLTDIYTVCVLVFYSRRIYY